MPLRYDVSHWQDFLWKDHKRCTNSTAGVLKQGRKKFEAFDEFAPEIFHRLYADQEKLLDEPALGSDWAEKLHQAAESTPEWQDVRERTRGNDWYSGMTTEALLAQLVSKVDTGGQQIPDPRLDAEVAEYLERMARNTRDPARKAKAQAASRQASQQAQDKLKAAQAAAKALDPTEARNAVRAAAKAATEAMDKADAIVDGLGQGSEAHGGQLGGRGAARKLASLVSDNDRLKRIAELAGRLRRIATTKQRSKPRKGTDEVGGVIQGNDLARMLPSEAVLAIDPDMEVVFARKLNEHALVQYEVRPRPRKEQGPIVMLLDSSGSMCGGDADVWAAAVALAFLGIAQQQGRAFVLMHFGTEVLRKDIFPAKKRADIDELLGAVSFFASCGGTRFQGPLDDAKDIIRELETFEDADIIMVTDGGAGVSEGWAQRFNSERQEIGASVYTILVGNYAYKDEIQKASDKCIFLVDAIKDDSDMHSLFGEV